MCKSSYFLTIDNDEVIKKKRLTKKIVSLLKNQSNIQITSPQ